MRKHLKIFQAHLGFYDTIVAAPSQKAALAAWGASRNEFAKGFAQVTTDPQAVNAALLHPGQVLRRPFGSKGAFKIDADRVAVPKSSPKASRAAKERRERAAVAQRKAAKREMREAEAQAARTRAEIRKREVEFAREKAAAENQARRRVAR